MNQDFDNKASKKSPIEQIEQTQVGNTLTNQPIVTIVAKQSSDGHYVLTDNRQTIDDRESESVAESDDDSEGSPRDLQSIVPVSSTLKKSSPELQYKEQNESQPEPIGQSLRTSTGDYYQHSPHSQLHTTSSATINPVPVEYQNQSTSWQPSGHHSPEQTSQTYPMTGATHQLYPTPVQTQQWHRNDRQNTYYNPHIQTQQQPIFIVVDHNRGTPIVRDQTADCKKITYTVLRIIQNHTQYIVSIILGTNFC